MDKYDGKIPKTMADLTLFPESAEKQQIFIGKCLWNK